MEVPGGLGIGATEAMSRWGFGFLGFLCSRTSSTSEATRMVGRELRWLPTTNVPGILTTSSIGRSQIQLCARGGNWGGEEAGESAGTIKSPRLGDVIFSPSHVSYMFGYVDPDRPRNDKGTILGDAIQMLKAEYSSLSEEEHELTQEKNELRDEKASWTGIFVVYSSRSKEEPSVFMGPPPAYPFPSQLLYHLVLYLCIHSFRHIRSSKIKLLGPSSIPALFTWHTLDPVILLLINHLTNLVPQFRVQVVINLTLLHKTVEASHLRCSKQAAEGEVMILVMLQLT